MSRRRDRKGCNSGRSYLRSRAWIADVGVAVSDGLAQMNNAACGSEYGHLYTQSSVSINTNRTRSTFSLLVNPPYVEIVIRIDRPTHGPGNADHQPQFPTRSQCLASRHSILLPPVAVSSTQGSDECCTLTRTSKWGGYGEEVDCPSRGRCILESKKLCDDRSKH